MRRGGGCIFKQKAKTSGPGYTSTSTCRDVIHVARSSFWSVLLDVML